MASTDRRLLKWIFIGSILLNIIAFVFFGRKLYHRYSDKGYVQPVKPTYYLDRNKLFDVLPRDSNAIVFLGNSLTQYFELGELLQNPDIKNRGIHGDMIQGVLARLEPIIATKPKKIFIEIGINDLEQKVPKETFLNQYQKLIDTLKTSVPGTRIYVQSLLPVANESHRLPSYCSPDMNRLIVDVNRQLKAIAASKVCTYIDVHSAMQTGGELKPEYSFDGVHLSAEGYLSWAKVLRPFVQE